MTFEEIEMRYRTAVLSTDGDEWDDPETDDDDDDDADDEDDEPDEAA